MAKTTCPITRTQFTAKAAPLTVVIDGKPCSASPKTFSTGSLGWFVNAKISVLVDGVPCQVQVGLNLTVVGSKELPDAPPSPEVQAIIDANRKANNLPVRAS